MKNTIRFTAKQGAKDLWEFGEDDFLDRALKLSDAELMKLHERAYENLNPKIFGQTGKVLPKSGYDLGFVTALTLIEFFEGKVRPLALKRRRNSDSLPKKLESTQEEWFKSSAKFS